MDLWRPPALGRRNASQGLGGKPAGQVTFEYDEPSEIEVAFRRDGGASIFVLAYNVKISANGTETIYEMPDGFSVENFPMGKR